MDPTADIAAAALAGRREALELEARLLAAEREERREFLTCAAAGLTDRAGDDRSPSAAVFDQGEGTLVARLRQDIEHLAHYQAAVERSRVWRTAQWLRRALGRSW